MLPSMLRARACATEDPSCCFGDPPEGADGEGMGLTQAVHVTLKGLNSSRRPNQAAAAQHHQHMQRQVRKPISWSPAGPQHTAGPQQSQHAVQRCLDGHASHQRGWRLE